MIPPQAASAAPRHFRLRCALAYGAPLGVNGIVLPYFPVWLESLSFSGFEIGLVLTVQIVMRVLAAPVAGMVADRLRERTFVLLWSGILSFLSALALFAAQGFWPVLIVIAFQAAVFAPYAPIVESIAVTGVRRWGFQYGSMRVWGSVGFVIVVLLVGELRSTWGGNVIPAALAIGFLLTIASSFAAPRLEKGVIASTPDGGPRPSALRRLDLHVLMIGASMINASHGMFYTFGTIHWHQIGFSSGAIGVLWSAAVVSEILVFFTAGMIARRVTPWTLMRIGCAVALVRWSLFPLPLGFGGYLVLQLTHAFTFALVHIGLQHRLVESVREDQESSMQGAYVFYNGTFLALSTLFSGLIYRQFGLASYSAMSLLALSGLATIAMAAKLQPQRSASGG